MPTFWYIPVMQVDVLHDVVCVDLPENTTKYVNTISTCNLFLLL